MKDVSILFLSIFLESLPFLLLGSFLSAIIETFISDETMEKLIRKNAFLGSIVGVFLGFFIPACDCAVIPVAKRLIKKKVPINVAVSFMLASPIINPVVLLSTYYAFYNNNPNIFWGRFILGIVLSLLIGLIMGIWFQGEEVTKEHTECHCHHSSKNKFLQIMHHTLNDLFEVVKYLMFGALIASVIQVYLPRSLFTLFQNNTILSVFVLMVFAYLVSLCSTSDSFVGRTLLSSFSRTSVLAYLLLGPMIDIKNTIVLFGNYKKSFVITLLVCIFISVFLSTLLIGGIL